MHGITLFELIYEKSILNGISHFELCKCELVLLSNLDNLIAVYRVPYTGILLLLKQGERISQNKTHIPRNCL
jgi:hypothetical protein